MNKDKIVLGIAILLLTLSLIDAYLVFLRPSSMQSYQQGYQDGYRADSSRKIAYGVGGSISFGIMRPDSTSFNAITLFVPGTDIGRWVEIELKVIAPESTYFVKAGMIVPRQETIQVRFDHVIVDKKQFIMTGVDSIMINRRTFSTNQVGIDSRF